MEGGKFGKLLVTQVLLFFLPQCGKGGTGNGDRNMLPVNKKDAINGIAMPGGDGSEKVHKPNLDGFCECTRADFKRANNIAHIVICPGRPELRPCLLLTFTL